MDVFNVLLFFIILKDCAGDFFSNVTHKGCLSFEGLSSMGNTVKMFYSDYVIFQTTAISTGEYVQTYGDFIGRIEDLNVERLQGKLFFCIANTKLSDGGSYIYKETDTTTHVKKLYVLGKPKIPTLTVISDGVVNFQKGELSCQSVSTSEPEGLDLSYSWTVNDSVITGIGKYKFDGSFDSTLIINVDGNDTFNTYRCFATEQRGQMSDISNSVQIDPKRKPKIRLKPNEDSYSILINQTLTIECVVLDAYPNVSVYKWNKNNSPLEPSGKYFTIANAKEGDSANYKCVASNSVGDGTANITVDVLYGPTVTVLTALSQVDGESIMITCFVQSNPPAVDGNVTWTKQDNTTFIKSGIQLNIIHVNRKDQGTFICSVNLTLQTSNGSSWKRSDSKAIHIHVLYGPIVTLLSSYNQLEGSSIIIRCDVQSNPTPTSANVIWRKQGNATFRQQGLLLNISSANKKDIGVFLCNATITLQPSEGSSMVRSDVKKVTVHVLYGPTIITMMTYHQFVGRRINKTCAIESYPAATDDNVIWTKQLNSSFRQNGFQLLIPRVSVSDQGTYVCTVQLTLQPTNGSSLMKSDNETISINVFYGPVISPMTRHSQIEGDVINKTCVIDSNPPASNRDVIWTKHENSTFVHDSLQLFFPSLNRKDNGIFECTVNITFRPTDGPIEWRTDSRTFEINVLYGPEITPMTKFSQEDGHAIMKACDVVSNPPAIGDDVEWTKIGNSTFRQNGLKLHIPALNRLDNGTFNCTVSIILIPTDGRSVHRSATENIEINVLYGPTIEPMTTYTPVEGDSFTINCKVQSNPPAKNNDVTWTKQSNTSFHRNGLTLSFITVDKKDHGSFVCSVSIILEPTNQIIVERKDTKAVLVDVLYPPIIGISGGNVVYEGNTTTALCMIDSNPLSHITWTYLPSNTYVPESNNISYSDYNVTSQLIFSPAKCETTGLYRCQASNNIQSPASKTVSIEVKCKPRLSSLENKVENITIGRNESLNHTIEFHAVPVPICSLQFNKTVVSDFKVDVVTNDLPYKSGCRIEKKEIKEADIGPYEITVNNSEGQSVVTFYIIFQREPDPPLLYAIDCRGQPRAATIKWKPRWNGGLPQSFFLQYKQKKDSNFTNGELFIDDGVKEIYTDTIYKLIPGTDYLFKVSASNDKGSAETHQINCTAIGEDDPETDTLLVIGATTGSLLGLLIVFVFTVFVFFFKRRTENQKKRNKNTQLITGSSDKFEEEDDEDGLKVNPMYESSGQIESVKNDGAVYSVVQKKKEKKDEFKIDGDSITVYSQVVKNERKGKGKTPTSNKKKTVRPADNKDKSIEMDCVYENSSDIKNDDGDMYANTDTDKGIPVKHEYQPTKNKDGLIYADLDLAPRPSDKRFIIRGLENRNNYAVIDLSKTAKPLPSDSDTDDEKDANKIVEKHGTGRQQEQT